MTQTQPATSSRRATVVAWSIAALVLALEAVFIRYWMLAYARGKSPDSVSLIVVVSIAIAIFAIFGGLIVSHRPDNPIGWIFGIAALFMALRGASGAWASWALIPEQDLPGALVSAWFSNLIWPPAIAGLGMLLPLLFPNGRLLSRRWRVVVWLCGTVIVLHLLGNAFAPGPLEDYAELRNPFSLGPPLGSVFDFLAGLIFLFPPLIITCVISLIIRARRAEAIEREQIKWIAYIGVLLMVGAVLVFAATPLENLWPFLIFGPLSAIPVASAIAIYRYRLFDIDRLISRTFSYVLVTAVLGGVFVLVALLPAAIAGTEDNPDWLIAIATLLVIALFRPVRRRVQGTVDRRFNRARFNTVQTIESFTAHLRDEVDLDALGSELRSVVARTMQPQHISLWLRTEHS